ncbi:MAG: hypothetical protein WBD99_02985 [Thermodesulfobacteriota bacterium]
MFCLSYCAWYLWFFGYPDKALERAHQTLTVAQGLSHPYSFCFALRSFAVVNQFRSDTRATLKSADHLIKLSQEQGFAYWLAWGTILRGWAISKQGQGDQGVSQIVEGLNIHKDTEGELGRPYFLALKAEANLEIGKAEEGLRALGEARELVSKNEDRFFDGELYRLEGELLLALSHDCEAEAEACFHQALGVVRRQSAVSLELRATMSLSRLLHKRGKKEQARKMLSETYGRFTEGFDTMDLNQARDLLEEL